MPEQLNREVLQKVIDAADAVISALAGENEGVHKDDSTKMCRLWDELNDNYAPPEIVRGMARMLLAGMGSEPVAWTDEQELKDLEKSGCAYLFTVNPITPNADPRRVIRLYTAPPAPVAVPDEKWVNPDIGYADENGFAEGWNACRAAMLKAEPVTAATVPEEKGSSLQLRNLIRKRHAEWSQKAFGNVGPVGPLKHLAKEAIEAAEAPDDLSEWADMQFLLWDAQRRSGISDAEITAAMEEKLKVNMARQWPVPKDGEPRLHI